jgi:predicted DNA-binding protein with PD1-like motif
MKFAQCALGRIFVLRLEDSDRIPDCIEAFAREQGVRQAYVSFLGGVGSGKIVVGPEADRTNGVRPMLHPLDGIHEAAAVGTIFPSESGEPVLHMHAALGRGGDTRTGCVRAGVDVWLIGEAVIFELTGGQLVRKKDPATGFELLEIAK